MSFYLRIIDQDERDYFLPISDLSKTVSHLKGLLHKLSHFPVQLLEIQEAETWRELDDDKALAQEQVHEDSKVRATLVMGEEG